jgi:glucosamine kinase
MSTYFINGIEMEAIIRKEVLPIIKKAVVDEVYYYGTGCSNISNAKIVKKALKNCFTSASLLVDTDVAGEARALCGK